ncbi:MAG: MFS transporter [Thiobacillus sp.]|jgi:MFS family permease|nr:MFS transporter [Thiobacillus sp.]
MSMSSGAGLVAPSGLALPLASVFVVAMGFGIVLPVLPFFLARVLGAGENESIAWHTGLLTAAYMFSLFLFAPFWGRVSDRIGRRAVILLGFAGFSVAILVFSVSSNLALAYTMRGLAGLFAAAIVPVMFAWIGDEQVPDIRARSFAWLYAASALGFLFGPAMSGWMTHAGYQNGPFYTVAALSGLLWFLAYRRIPEGSRSRSLSVAPEVKESPFLWLQALTLLVMLGLGSFEVGIALHGRLILDLGPREIGWLFAECSLIMILVQTWALPHLIRRQGGDRLLAPGFLAMAAGVGLLPYASTFSLSLLAVGLFASASGLLIPALAYLVSLAAGAAQGAALGQQTATASLGQAVGSATAGWLFTLLGGALFWAMAGLLFFGSVSAYVITGMESRGRS